MAFSHCFVVPSYNQGQYLAATLDSLLEQDDPCSEILISEDFSTDNSPAVAAAYATRYPGKVRVTSPPTHEGMFPNWNWGISQTKAEWVSIMGADDQAMPNFVTTIREGIAKTPNVVVVGANWDFVDGDGNLGHTEKMLSMPEVMRPPQTFYKQIFANRVHPAAHAFRRVAWEKVGGIPAETKLYGDWALWLLMTPLGDFVHMRRVIARYRINYRPGLELVRMNQNLRDEITVRLDLIPRIARQFPHVAQWRLRLASRRRFRHMLDRINLDLVGADPSEQVRIFEPWARDLGPGAQRLLDRFARGEPIGHDWYDRYFIAPLRRIYKTFLPSSAPAKPALAKDPPPPDPIRLSIVVPVKNGDADWMGTLTSALAQTAASDVVAVVAGGDALRAAVERTGRGRARVIAAPEGVEEPAGRGIEAATGNWIVVARPGARLDADLAAGLVDLASRTPGAVALIAGTGAAACAGAWPDNFMRGLSGALDEAPSFAFGKAAWQAAGGYQPEIAALADRALLLKLALQGPCASGLAIGTVPPATVDRWERLRDVEFLHRLLAPALVARRGGIPRERLLQAGRIAFRALARSALGLSGAERHRTADLLADWAENLGEADVLDDLRAGRSRAIRRPIGALKRRLRSFYKALR